MTQDQRTEDYLDHVCAPLVGVVPYVKRQELRAELRAHLEAMVASYQELGQSPEMAVVEALRQFGDPRDLARQWAREWKGAASPARLTPVARAMVAALGCFGLATAAALIFVWITMTPGGYSLGEDAWRFVPFLLTLLFFLLPLLSGIATGLLAPARSGLGTFYALAVILAIVPLAANSDPSLNGLGAGARDLTIVQACAWMPIGCGTAALVGWLRTRLAPRPGQWVLQ
jgi:hypothetical protein